MKRARSAVLLFIAAALFWPQTAAADTVSIGLEQGPGGIMTVASGSGAATVTQAFGTFSNVHVSGQGQSTLTAPDLLLSDTISTSAAMAGTLNIFVTDSGLTSPVGNLGFTSAFTANLVPAGWSITGATLLSTSNALYSGTPIGQTAFTSIGTNTEVESALAGNGPYSVTEEYTLVATGAGDTNNTINLSAAPLGVSASEPSLLIVMGFGLCSIGFLLRRRVQSIR